MSESVEAGNTTGDSLARSTAGMAAGIVALAVTCVLVLGPQLADTPVPLSLLLSKGIGNAGPVVTATVAGLLALGSITSYLAGAKAGSARRWLETAHCPLG